MTCPQCDDDGWYMEQVEHMVPRMSAYGEMVEDHDIDVFPEPCWECQGFGGIEYEVKTGTYETSHFMAFGGPYSDAGPIEVIS